MYQNVKLVTNSRSQGLRSRLCDVAQIVMFMVQLGNQSLSLLIVCRMHLPWRIQNPTTWLAQLVKALATPTHVCLCMHEVWVRSPEQTSLTLASSRVGKMSSN